MWGSQHLQAFWRACPYESLARVARGRRFVPVRGEATHYRAGVGAALMLAPCAGNLHSKHRGGWAGTQADDYSYGPQVGEKDGRGQGLAGGGMEGISTEVPG